MRPDDSHVIDPRTGFRLLILTILFVGFATSSCADEETFIDCPFSNSIEESCTSYDATVAFTCVVESHPFCPDQICASWEGSRSFCSQACTDDVDCPEASTCRTSLSLSFCVPDEELSSGG
jgi:hypothetical protein